LNIINPYFKIDETKDINIFNIRMLEYNKILDNVKEIVKPVEEIGFTISEINLKDSKFSTGELNKTIRKNLIIKLQKGSSNIDLNLLVPKIVDNNYIIINGRRKIPLFQLFDIPVVTRGNNIKLRTNISTLMISESSTPPYIKLSFMGKTISLALIILAYYSLQDIETKFDLNVEFGSSLYDKFLIDLKDFIDESVGFTQDDFILEVGRAYTKYNIRTKGEDIIYALDLIPKVDIMSANFLKNKSIIDEMIEVLKKGDIDDTLLTNKRVRCLEYMITSKISKIIFDFCMANRNARHPKFNINSTQILSDCNVSDIVQFDFSINPIEELTKLSRSSLLGPGGFKRENVPKHLRDISQSMFGRICPVDTPDRDNCGILQNLVPNVDLDSNLKFTENICEKQPISIPVSFVPFLDHDDQTRLQMASSQMRQSIMLRNFDEPMIQSGCEGLYTDYTHFVKRAKKDGEVVYLDNNYLIVNYIDTNVDIFDISYKKIYVENLDFMNIYVKVGDKFKSGDILAESNFCKDGKVIFGKNLLTAIVTYYGNNYEDGIVLSDRLVKDGSFTSVHYKDLSFIVPPNRVLLSLSKDKYKPLPDILETIEVGQSYAKIKSVSGNDIYSIFNEDKSLEARKKLIITETNIYPNLWSDEIPEYNGWVKERIKKQQEKENELKKIIYKILPKKDADIFIRDNNLEKFSFTKKYRVKKETINGMLVKMFGIYFRNIEVGDKIANRHGNKGVVSTIIPHKQMPQLEDGRHVDICINPLGIISRMNIGQLYELHLSMSLVDLKKQLENMLKDENVSQKQIKKHLLDYIKIVDNTENQWLSEQFLKLLPKEIDHNFIQDFSLIQPPFESITKEKIKEALSYTKTSFDQFLYDPVSKQNLEQKIALGYLYFFRLVHISENRLAGRGIGAYSRRTLQPLGGRKNLGGQRIGEMETSCLIAHDSPETLIECFTTKSDCIDLKNDYIKNIINPSLLIEEDKKETDNVPESVKLLNSYLTVLGVKK